jgi:transcriptional regulator with XRE-family HTH domain
MSLFSERFSALMSLPDAPTQQELSTASGVDRASISRYLSGTRFPVVDQIVRLVCNISTDRERRLELLISYLRDIASRCHGSGFDERHYTIDINGSESATFAHTFELLYKECLVNPVVMDGVQAIISLLLDNKDKQKTIECYSSVIKEHDLVPRKVGSWSITQDPVAQPLQDELNRRNSSSETKSAS